MNPITCSSDPGHVILEPGDALLRTLLLPAARAFNGGAERGRRPESGAGGAGHAGGLGGPLHAAAAPGPLQPAPGPRVRSSPIVSGNWYT